MRISKMAKIAWELIDLQVFSAVARRSSFTGAAIDLGMSVANVTKRIARLEQALSAPLFLRTTRRVSITTQGETVYLWARKVLEAAEALDQEVASSRDSLVGTLRVSTSHRLGSRHIAPILALMRQQHPGLDLWLELVDRRVDLLAEDFDIDIRVGDVHEPHLVAYPVAHSARVLCASPDYLARRGRPTRLAELAEHDVLLFRDRDRPFGMLRLQGPQGADSVQVGGPMGSNQSDAIMQWALQGLGIALLSQWDVADALRQGLLERVLPLFEQPANVFAVMPVRSSQSLKLNLCLGFLRDHLAQGPHALQVA
jgi:LysR family transcriptional regulator, transcriptional activator for dmlA